MKKVRLREVMLFVQGHTDIKLEWEFDLFDLIFPGRIQTLGLDTFVVMGAFLGALGGTWGLWRLQSLILGSLHSVSFA